MDVKRVDIKTMLLLVVIVGMISACSADSNIDGNVVAETADNTISEIDEDPEKVQIYFFWGDGCPYCAEQKEWHEKTLKEEFGDDIQINEFETYNSRNNVQIMQTVASAYDTVARGVPMTFIGDEYWRGFSADSMGPQILSKVEECIDTGCESPGARFD